MFLDNHVQTWMKCAATRPHSQGRYRSLLDLIDNVGIDALFCLENLRRNHDPSFCNNIFDKLEEVTSISPSFSLRALPHIFLSYVRSLRLHRSALYAQGSNRDVAPPDGLRADGMSFFMMCNSLIDKYAFAEGVWSARHALLALVEQEDLFSVFQRDAEDTLSQVGHLAIDALDDIDKRTPTN